MDEMIDAAERAYEERKESLGQALHEQWRERMRTEGFSTHQWETKQGWPGVCHHCSNRKTKHHNNMVDWADLTQEVRDSFIRQTKGPFLAGYGAGVAAAYVKVSKAGLVTWEQFRSQAWGDPVVAKGLELFGGTAPVPVDDKGEPS